jgi:[glutamine synthetase] adenylyltransferase / [glutamine synthetase]-adenylyl-L-tyrosine phosphorylase
MPGIDELTSCLASAEEALPTLLTWNVRDLAQGWQNLRHLAEAIGHERLTALLPQLERLLPRCPDPDMALNNLERFLAVPAAAEQLPKFLEGRARTLEILVQLFSTSQYFSDLLVANPDCTDMLRVPLRRSPSREELQSQLQAEVDAAFEDSAVLRVFRRYRQRQTLRIGTNDIIRDRPLEEVTRDISRVADVAVRVALNQALKTVTRRFGKPCDEDGTEAHCVILAFGKLGGEELNYSSDIDLMVVFDHEGTTSSKMAISNVEFFDRVTTELVRLLSTHPQAYRIDLRLRPEGQRGPLARSLASTLSYYDAMGRTWERQALIKIRPIAGDMELGKRFLEAIEPYVYRKYLSFAEINEIKALKRRIELKTSQAGESSVEVKTGHGGIRDVEFTIQFLQLANGGDLPEVRGRNTLTAIQSLQSAGCLTDQEARILDDGYRFLRKVEHRLQLMFDLQTHRLPERPDEVQKLALRMGYRDGAARGEGEAPAEPGDVEAAARQEPRPPGVPPSATALIQFLQDYREKTSLNRHILNHLLHDTFQGDDVHAEPETDLILDPAPDAETIRQVLDRYRFRDVQGAYHNLMQLAQENVPFLSQRRCRHFLASIAPDLLKALAETPDPDMALVNLEKVTSSLGAKGVLWELFSFNRPSLRLYVDLCAWSQFLSEILISNPGMIDELLDTLVLNQPRTKEELRDELGELCHGAEDVDVILHSFRDNELLRIGVCDILGRETLQATTGALSDLAETILSQIADLEFPKLVQRFGLPHLADGPDQGQPSRWVLLGLGKFGGHEMSYNSDLDLILVYEGDGRTDFGFSMLDSGLKGRATASTIHNSQFRFQNDTTDNFHFFSELAQRIIKTTSLLGPHGRLYAVDMRLRPTGKSGSLVIPLAEFRRYYGREGEARREGEAPAEPPRDGQKGSAGASPSQGAAQLWERQALTRARVVHGDAEFGEEVMAEVRRAAYGLAWRPEYAAEIAQMRRRLEASRSDRDLKRGFGGGVDVEFLVQLFQIKYANEKPSLRTPNTWQALDALHAEKLLPDATYLELKENYDLLRRVESRLRIVHNFSQDELPAKPEDLEKLARRLGYESGSNGGATELFLRDMEKTTARTRELFQQMIEREGRRPSRGDSASV